MNKWQVPVVILLAALLSYFSGDKVFHIHKTTQATQFNRLIYLPDILVSSVSLEFQGVVSDYLMLNLLVIHGEKLLNEVIPTREEWELTYLGLQKITHLDPRFMDPYVFAQMSLPWDAGMVEETNSLLLNAAEVLTDDPRPNFFLWFNYFYFLNDAKTAGMYLQKAAEKPGAPRYYTTLAARMNLYGGDIVNGIIFLGEMINKTNDPTSRKYWKIRLECLEKIAYLESRIKKFREEYNREPESLAELIDIGILEKIPEDPYGGQFYINEQGRVYTTSKMVLPKKK
jgi:hypothetical protein